VLLFAWAAEVVGGLAAITGAFLAGVGLSRSPLRDKTEAKIRTITYTFLVPVFFVSIGLQADARSITGPSLLFLGLLLLVAVVSKVVGSGAGARLGGFSGRQALRVGVGMVSRGEVGLIVASVGVSQGLVDPALFSVVVVLVLLTTILTPVLLRQVSRGGAIESGAGRGGLRCRNSSLRSSWTSTSATRSSAFGKRPG
jgi:Kef-type K+ transport system membrane component KefB